MPQLSIDPIKTYYSVTKSLIGRILIFYFAGWLGILLGRFAEAFQAWDDFSEPLEALSSLFKDSGVTGIVMEFMRLVAWPAVVASSAAQFSVLIFFIAMPAIIITFAVFVYSEEPPPAWCLALAGFVSILHLAGVEDATLVSWLVLGFFLVGIGSAFWWALRVFHPELVQTVGDLFRGRSRQHVSVMSDRHKAPPGTYGPDPAEGWANRSLHPPPRDKSD